MWSVKHVLLTAGGGAITAAALLGGVAMAQTPAPSTPSTPTTPAPTAPAAPGSPDAPDQPTTPRQRGGADCPEKGGTQGSQGTQTTRTSTVPRFYAYPCYSSARGSSSCPGADRAVRGTGEPPPRRRPAAARFIPRPMKDRFMTAVESHAHLAEPSTPME